MAKKSIMFMGNEWKFRAEKFPTMSQGNKIRHTGEIILEYIRKNYILTIYYDCGRNFEKEQIYLARVHPKKKHGDYYKVYAEGYGRTPGDALTNLERTICGFRAITDPCQV